MDPRAIGARTKNKIYLKHKDENISQVEDKHKII